MKVLFLTNIPSPYRVDFFDELGKKCELTVLYELERASDRDERWKSNKSNNFRKIFLSGKKIGTDSAICFSVLKYLKDKSYDIIVIGGYSTPTGMLAIEFLKFINRPFILNVDGGMIKNDSKLKYRIKKHFIKSASCWLSTGRNTTDYLLNYGAKKENIFVYPFTSIKENEIVQSILSKEEKYEVKSKLGIKEEKVIISVGQFIYRKGYDILLKTCENLDKSIGVYIIGGKPINEYLKLKEELNITNVYFVDFKSKEEIKEYYEAADLFVLPTREDIWGLVINEAMAQGLPVITTNKCVAGLELIENIKNGYIVEVENYVELANKINYIINNEKSIEKMASNNLDKIKNYTIENMAKVHIDIFKKILENKRGENR